MDVNQKYCQSCHLISHNELTDTGCPTYLHYSIKDKD
jgi:hypothetical protein